MICCESEIFLYCTVKKNPAVVVHSSVHSTLWSSAVFGWVQQYEYRLYFLYHTANYSKMEMGAVESE